MTSGVVARDLRKAFGPRQALDGVDLDVAFGEVVALLGRNGAGKSTLLRVLGTTVLPDSGQAHIVDYDLVRQAVDVRRRVGVVLGDERSWYWRLSGRANLEFFGSMYGLSRARARTRAVELLEMMHLADRADDRFDGYSAGMRARLSLARALLTEPRVLLLDEPTRTLDPVAAARFRVMLRDLAQDQRAILWVTHDLHEAAGVADRVLLMDAGRIHSERSGPSDAAELELMMLSVGAQ